MEMSHVRYFLALCQERNFTRAARRCNVAQPSLTKAIKMLEAEVGPLFVRRHSGVELTELGSTVEPYFAAIDRCVKEIKQATGPVSAIDREIAEEIERRLSELERGWPRPAPARIQPRPAKTQRWYQRRTRNNR
jgi:DNA-binding transcriptional LysR family regulator